MSERRYLKPPWMQRNVGNRIAPLFQRTMLSKLSVRGRRSGRWHTVPVGGVLWALPDPADHPTFRIIRTP